MTKNLFLTLSIALAAEAFTPKALAGDLDYSQGVFILNEDWYGHQNSTLNYLLPDDPNGDYWHYRVIQAENPGIEIGCTASFGAVFEGRIYLISKQDKAPGASVTGGRITVADASSLRLIHQSQLIDPSGAMCDGRGFLGVTAQKGYVSSSNGIWVLDLVTNEVTGMIPGTGTTSDSGSLYEGQCGSMVIAAGKVFAAHQQLGLLVIDAATDQLISTISLTEVDPDAGIGSVVKALDGSIWVSIAADTYGSGSALSYLMRVDQQTLDTEVVALGDDISAPRNSWYAWTPDAFCASYQTNTLYWCGGDSWFGSPYIYKFDIESRTATRIVDLDAEGDDWHVYGCSMRIHPDTDEIYASLLHQVTDPTYILRRYDSDGTYITDYPMISNYWFPSLPIFPTSPDNEAAIIPVAVDTDASVHYFNLQGQEVDPTTAPRGIYIRRQGPTATKTTLP